MNKKVLKFLKEDSECSILGYSKNDCPVIACWKFDDIHLSFYCLYCKKIHLHGLGDGHRVAHCSCECGGYSRTGYILCSQGEIPGEDQE